MERTDYQLACAMQKQYDEEMAQTIHQYERDEDCGTPYKLQAKRIQHSFSKSYYMELL